MTRKPEEVLRARLEAVRLGERGRVAGLAGISPNHYARWISGEVPINPKLSTLKALAEALDVPLPRLIADESTGAEHERPTRRDLDEVILTLVDVIDRLSPADDQTAAERGAAIARRARNGSTGAKGATG